MSNGQSEEDTSKYSARSKAKPIPSQKPPSPPPQPPKKTIS
ncbi:MAG: hypothetical protein ACK5RE_20365 [Pseudanabaena sp.]|jgi:hypothetical protein